MPTEQMNVPRHVAIIMDGNGRWAKKQHLPRHFGHRAGVESVRGVVETSVQKGIEVLTLFAFSSENWRRPQQEVGLLMDLFMTALHREVRRLQKNDVRLRVIGDRAAFSDKLRERIQAAEAQTRNNTGMTLVIAANYGGRWDITTAAKALGQRIESGELRSADITPELVAEGLSLREYPDPDLFIRTGGEQRISNFLLWQLAYTEFYFSEILWPDFNVHAYEQALHEYSKRQRRFGRTGDQVEERLRTAVARS